MGVYKARLILVMIIIAALLSGETAFAGTADIFYNYELCPNGATTRLISEYMSDIGYNVDIFSLSTKRTLKNSFDIETVVYVRTHADGGILVCTDGDLLANDIDVSTNDFSNLKLAYLSGCNSATTTSNGNYLNALTNRGASSVIGFSDIISWYTETTEVNYLDQRVFYYLSHGSEVAIAVYKGMVDAMGLYGSNYGIPSITYRGASTIL